MNMLLSGAVGALLVWILQYFTEKRRRRYERRLYILRSLIANSANVVSVDFVSAFNMILIEYGSKSDVRKWHAKFMEHVSEPIEESTDLSKTQNRDKKFETILIKLIEAVARSIHIEIEQLDVKNKIYWPQGFANAAAKQQRLTDLLITNQDCWNKLLAPEKNDKKLVFEVKHKIKKSGKK